MPGITKQPDWAQAFAKMGATCIAGTGYQYGDTEFIEYSERLYLEFARELLSGSAGEQVSIGQALVKAKRKYLSETPLMRGIHEKSIIQTTLFGFPMMKLGVTGNKPENPPVGTLVPDGFSASGVDYGPGKFFGLKVADLTELPTYLESASDYVTLNLVDLDGHE